LTLIFVDSREQRPFRFPKQAHGQKIKTQKKKLTTGDYIPRGYSKPRGGIVVERKGLGDFMSCMTGKDAHARFKAQLKRLSSWTRSIVVVEGKPSSCSLRIFSERQWTPQTLMRRVAYLQATFNVPIMMAETRSTAESFALDWIMWSMHAIQEQELW